MNSVVLRESWFKTIGIFYINVNYCCIIRGNVKMLWPFWTINQRSQHQQSNNSLLFSALVRGPKIFLLLQTLSVNFGMVELKFIAVF